MEMEIILEKEKHYEEELEKLVNFNVDEKVTLILKSKEEEIRNEVIAGLTKDILQCKHYLEILKELKDEINKTEEKVEEPIVNIQNVSEEA